MKLNDVVRLSANELRYDKKECVLSILLQMFILACVFFLLTIGLNFERVVSEYIAPLYEDGFEFELVGYTEADNEKLADMGFYNVSYGEFKNYGYINSLENIWSYKIKAAMDGKDIWSEHLDVIVSVLLFCKVMFLFLGVSLIVIMTNNIANSYTMKLANRQRFISMLLKIEAKRSECGKIFNIYFFMRMIIAVTGAVLINAYSLKRINAYTEKNMFVFSRFPVMSWDVISIVTIASFLILILLFYKRWRKNIYE